MNDHADHLTVDVDTTHGTLRGEWHDDIAHFAGIPFAAPPVGDLRFLPPRPPAPWSGVRDALDPSPVAPQNPSIMEALFEGSAAQWDEDCLYLNVWTPEPSSPTGGPGRPVMVWIHGGGFEMGSGTSPLYDGTHFASRGVVLVTLNYRLGALGFIELGGLDPSLAGSANNGLLDQVTALEWVRDNISSFGGDPTNVTVFGQSAGAMSVSLLLSMPRAQGLFTRAIAQSGSTNAARTPARAHDDTRSFMDAGGFADVDDLRSAPVTELLAAHAAVSAERVADPELVARTTGDPMAFLPFRPVADGDVVPMDPLAEIAAGAAAGIDLIGGSTSEEWKLFSMFLPKAEDEDQLRSSVALLVDDVDGAVAALRADHPDAEPEDLRCAAITDAVFTAPVAALTDAQASHAPTYRYLWAWGSPAWGGMLGAAHAIELPFVFGLVEDHRLHAFVGADAPVALSHDIIDSWVSFATTGDPTARGLAWPQADDSERRVMIFDTEIAVVADPRRSMTDFLLTHAS